MTASGSFAERQEFFSRVVKPSGRFRYRAAASFLTAGGWFPEVQISPFEHWKHVRRRFDTNH